MAKMKKVVKKQIFVDVDGGVHNTASDARAYNRAAAVGDSLIAAFAVEGLDTTRQEVLLVVSVIADNPDKFADILSDEGYEDEPELEG